MSGPEISRRRRSIGVARTAGASLALALLTTALVPLTAAAAPADCKAAQPGGPMQVTADCVDPQYANPVIDSQSDENAPVAYHKVSGHFEGTEVQFNIYLPPANQWKGRFFQYTYPTAFTPEQDTSKASDRAIGFSIASGGYAVQTGNAGTTLGYRHTAAAAKFAEKFAADYYHSGNREIYGYLYGPSGGSFQTTGAAENTNGVWEGFVPMVQGVPMSGPYTFLIRSMARLVLEDKAEQIADAVRPGGSGNPYAGLNPAEKDMLKELTAFGVPLQAWENPDYLLSLSSPDDSVAFGEVIKSVDAGYADDFWTKPGYLGTEQSALGDFVRAALAERGDTADNRWNIALRAYYRYQVPPTSDGYTNFDQFRNRDGSPKYPQRAFLVGPAIFGSVSGGAAYNGKINGKMIVTDMLYDVDALPVYADWYAKRVKAALGDRGFRDNYRLYYNDHADHLDGPVDGFRATYLVNYYGIVEQALRDMSAWVEKGVKPADSSRYNLRNGQIVVPDSASSRQGIQPTVDLTVRGCSSVTVKVGQSVTFDAKVQVPQGTGKIVATEWDFAGTGTYTPVPVERPKPTVQIQQTHRFDDPGTYFVAVKVTSQRDGVDGPFFKVLNLDRVRVVVHG
jgi:hypothetical protein